MRNDMDILKKRDGCFWPSEQQELLLRAALQKGREALDAWKEWRACVDIDDIDRLDSGSYRLLPLLYRNLNNQGVQDPLMMRLKGVYRLTWYKNQMLFHTMANLLRSFRDAGIETMALKGAALTLLCYKDYGLRPMNDFDVLIRTEKANAAIRLLEAMGWTATYFVPTEEYITVSYSHGFKNSAGQEFDLHWHLLFQSRGINADDDFWDAAVTTNINDIAVKALSPADQLLHVCIHGARWNFIPPFRWVADAMTILNAPQANIDWNRFIIQTEKRRLVLPLLDALNYLKEVFDAPIAPSVFKRLRDMPVPGIERLEYKIAVNPPTQWTAALDLWCQHSRLAGNVGLARRVAGFPKFLENIWGIAAWKLPFHGLSKIMTWHENRVSKKPPE
jgi:hypothetical protein